VSIIYQVSRYTSLWIYYYGIPYAQMTLKKLAFALRTSYHLAIYEDEFIVIASYVLCSILGVFYKNHFFSLHLFFLFSRISLLNNVFQAISYNAIQLVVVAQLGTHHITYCRGALRVRICFHFFQHLRRRDLLGG
jgi:hypothetical protein